METDRPHPYKQDPKAIKMVCDICGKYSMDSIHNLDNVKITGIAKPTKIG